jgi:hypothetical protein
MTKNKFICPKCQGVLLRYRGRRKKNWGHFKCLSCDYGCLAEFEPPDFKKPMTKIDLEKEVARLKEGNFTEEEFQNLCHKFQQEDITRFCKGCENYQTKLFGRSPITELKNERDKLLAEIEDAKNLVKDPQGRLMVKGETLKEIFMALIDEWDTEGYENFLLRTEIKTLKKKIKLLEAAQKECK